MIVTSTSTTYEVRLSLFYPLSGWCSFSPSAIPLLFPPKKAFQLRLCFYTNYYSIFEGTTRVYVYFSSSPLFIEGWNY